MRSFIESELLCIKPWKETTHFRPPRISEMEKRKNAKASALAFNEDLVPWRLALRYSAKALYLSDSFRPEEVSIFEVTKEECIQVQYCKIHSIDMRTRRKAISANANGTIVLYIDNRRRK